MSTDPLIPARLRELFLEDLFSRLIGLRRDLHRFPELAFEEERTAERIQRELEQLQAVQVERVAGTGVVAILPGRDPGAPVVALRGDIDALPIQEETGLPFASERPGIMHACGHDVHASWTVGAAALLAKNPAEGNVVILLQPAEEVGKGAEAILRSGVLDNVNAIIGAHVDRRFDVGMVVAQEGPLAASTDTFEIELVGKGGHGARPHETIDPFVGAAALITALQSIVARRLDPSRAAVVSVGIVRGGTAPNVIPERVFLSGTLRANDSETRQRLITELLQLSRDIAAAHLLSAEIRVERGTPALVNAARDIAWAREAVVSLLGADALAMLPEPNMAGEDFAFYLQRMRGCFLRIGAREHGGEMIPAHAPKFYAPDESLFVGAAVLAETARVAARRLLEESSALPAGSADAV